MKEWYELKLVIKPLKKLILTEVSQLVSKKA